MRANKRLCHDVLLQRRYLLYKDLDEGPAFTSPPSGFSVDVWNEILQLDEMTRSVSQWVLINNNYYYVNARDMHFLMDIKTYKIYQFNAKNDMDLWLKIQEKHNVNAPNHED